MPPDPTQCKVAARPAVAGSCLQLSGTRLEGEREDKPQQPQCKLSLPVIEIATLIRAVSCVRGALRSGGVLVAQLLRVALEVDSQPCSPQVRAASLGRHLGEMCIA